MRTIFFAMFLALGMSLITSPLYAAPGAHCPFTDSPGSAVIQNEEDGGKPAPEGEEEEDEEPECD